MHGNQSANSLNLGAVCVATACLAAAVGASYAYVDLSLNRLGVSATAIGANASMPALAWLLATPLMPWALRRFDPRRLLLALLSVAGLASLGFALLPDGSGWLALRFLFGGGTGVVFRVIEYWISASSPAAHRARNIGIYAAAFCAGAATGAGALPAVGLAGWPPVLLILCLVGAGAAVLGLQSSGPTRSAEPPRQPLGSLSGPAVVGVTAAFAFGLFEAVPYTFMPIYAMRVGLTETWAALGPSAFLLGALLFPVPMGMLADRFGRLPVMALCTLTALTLAVGLPAAAAAPETLMLAMVLWGGFSGSLYTAALAMLADHFRNADLSAANAVFGTLYAAGALAGPPAHGAAMEWSDPQGLAVSAALLFAGFLTVIAWQFRRTRRVA